MKVKPWQLLTVLIVGAVVLVGGFYLVAQWQRNKPAEPVREMQVSVSSGENTLEVEPYTICELDAECDGGEPPTMPLDTSVDVTVAVPKDLASTSWRLLSIYDDPSANEEQIFQSGEATDGTVPAVKDGAQLVVAEVSALAVDTNDSGQEIPVIATWSVGFDVAS
ncbi:DUF2771 domain-containing protein [Corynebacterium qintianiae]|uniref:DUF2771 domain-containing protein n=1 Tax=Corynebacterium qintianiae TaxID=2709392 RepID=A0A7T0PE99_9CORY|nr:DUF2771 family protein [Corynebacterium qintianiae]QPK83773.1 DUF2771 domain-containing protein [Corynebacterium qintianiae]